MRISDWSSDVCSSDLIDEKLVSHDILSLLVSERGDDAAGDRALLQFLIGIVDLADVDLPGDQIVQIEATLQVQLRVHRDIVLDIGRAHIDALDRHLRTEASRVGNEGVMTCRSRWSPSN